MTRYLIEPEADPSGWRFRLLRKGRFQKPSPAAAPDDWSAAARSHPGAALLLALLDQEEAQRDADAMAFPHARAARLTRAEAARLGLPGPAPFTLFLSHDAPVADPGFRLRVDWFERNGAQVRGVRREGTALRVGDRQFLLLDPLYSALEALEAVNEAGGDPSPGGLDRRMAAYARFKDRLVGLTGDLRADAYLRGLTIHHATGLGIDLEPGAERPFAPILYGDRPADPVAGENGESEPGREPLLPSHHAQRLQSLFTGEQGARPHYVLGNGVYAVLDEPVAAALAVVERVNRGGEAQRQAFRQDPMAFLVPAIEAAGGDGGLICELRGYGARVIGIGNWTPPALSFPLPVTREWFPSEGTEVFTLAIPDGPPLVVRAEDIGGLKEGVAKARDAGAAEFEFEGRRIGLTPELEETIARLVEPLPGVPTTPREGPPAEPRPLAAALTRDNEERLTFLARQRAPQRTLATEPPALKNRAKPHQVEGIRWLQAAFLAGAPGVLLADDMGLGKTYQVLAFLAWLRAALAAGGQRSGPFLVVAPKTLLGNWREELDLHLGAGALGEELHVHDAGLRQLRQEWATGNDTRLGRQTLDVDRIAAADLVLTTYETLRDYHLSFGKVPFAAIVYDEAQKVKNPASLMNRGAKAQQGDFVLMLTGTPVENSVLDLWTLLDIAWPGFLGYSAKELLHRYRGDDETARQKLKARLVEPTRRSDGEPVPAIMLRRFKDDILDGLPRRRVEAVEEPMPEAQWRAYDAVLAESRKGPGGVLEKLQRLRTVSLHPNLAHSFQGIDEGDAFIAASARFRALFRILDRIHANGEKALIFVDLRDAQRALYDLIRQRYPLESPLPETINGSTAAPVRDRIRRRFQKGAGFDVLILGPRAAGFGLTLTAANHVIHLNRWWNPAVEDQCSDRVYRIGQDRPVTIHLPLAVHPQLGERSFDRLLHELLEEKRTLSRDIVIPVQFDEADFGALLQSSLGEGQDAPGPDLLARIDSMDWRAFEHWTAHRLQQAGYQVQVSRGAGDGGVDLIGLRPGTRPLFVQCKHRSAGAAGDVDESAIWELLRAHDARRMHEDPVLVAVTNGRFPLATASLAKEHGVLLVARDRLVEWPGLLE